LVAHSVRLLRDRRRRRRRVLRVGTARGDAEDLVALGETFGARGLDDSGEVLADHRRERSARGAATDLPVDRVDRGRVDPDQDLALVGLGTPASLEMHPLGPAGLVDDDRPHRAPAQVRARFWSEIRSWTNRTTAAPSPTAVAQRLIEPARTSPAQ